MAIFVALLILLALWGFTRFYLRGESLAPYDHVPGLVDSTLTAPSEEHYEVLDLINELSGTTRSVSSRQRLAALRTAMDEMGDKADLEGIRIAPVDTAGVDGEWVLADGADPDRRLLYLHGGSFTMGSPRSHRVITSKLSRIAGASVLAVDYRLMPEYRRLEGLSDCQSAYRWILANGPQGPSPLQTLFVAGDSAGGNLTLAVIAWARDHGLRAADGAVALSPVTDGTMSSPSILSNLESDHMLAPAFQHLAKVPSGVILWVAWLMARVRPCDPRVSPAHGDLANLPPTLVQCSEAEMLLDDGRRYVNKAREAGSEATLETWHHMVHAWHAFEHTLPEAREAFDSIAAFLEKCAPRGQQGQ
jgi:monoterpene epsilon-lactone hydrolase